MALFRADFQGTILALVVSFWCAAVQAGEDSGNRQEVTLRGGVILLEESDNSPIGKPQELKLGHRYGLRTIEGDLYRFLPEDPLTKMFSDPRVRQRELQITARLLDSHQLEIIRIHALHGERLYKILGIIYPSDEFQDSGAKLCIDILLRQPVLAIPISHQY